MMWAYFGLAERQDGQRGNGTLRMGSVLGTSYRLPDDAKQHASVFQWGDGGTAPIQCFSGAIHCFYAH